MQLTDPLTFFEDLGVSDPEGRTEKLLTLQTNPQEYLARFVMKMGNNPQQMGQALNGMPPAPQGQPPAPAPMEQPQLPSPQDTSQMPAEPPAMPQASGAML